MSYLQFKCSFPKFKDYHDNRGRGWCLLFNQVSFKQHPFTRDCELERVAEEDIIHPLYTEGERVKLIDPNTDYTQWTSCIVVAKKFNPFSGGSTQIRQNPQESQNIAEKVVGYIELLELQVEILTEDNHELTSQLIQMYEQIPTGKPKPTSATLPPFLKCHRH